eukprot:scaffold108361_cov28-Tisochrysis_lutea.AAC.2
MAHRFFFRAPRLSIVTTYVYSRGHEETPRGPPSGTNAAPGGACLSPAMPGFWQGACAWALGLSIERLQPQPSPVPGRAPRLAPPPRLGQG